MKTISLRTLLLATALLPLAGCPADDDGTDGNEEEVITTVRLTFTPTAGGAPVIAAFDDPDGDGGEPPSIDPVALNPGTYTLAVAFENGLEDPPEDITVEVNDESDQHQLFFTGDAVDGPASDVPGAPLTQAYADTDANGLPVGLTSDVTAAPGSGTLTVTLRHLPPIGGTAVKVAGLAEDVAAGGLAALPGESDASVSFDVTVAAAAAR